MATTGQRGRAKFTQALRAFPITNGIRGFPTAYVGSTVDAILLSGDMQSGTDELLLSGDMQSGTDVLLAEHT